MVSVGVTVEIGIALSVTECFAVRLSVTAECGSAVTAHALRSQQPTNHAVTAFLSPRCPPPKPRVVTKVVCMFIQHRVVTHLGNYVGAHAHAGAAPPSRAAISPLAINAPERVRRRARLCKLRTSLSVYQSAPPDGTSYLKCMLFFKCMLGTRSGFESPGLDRPGRLPHQQGLCEARLGYRDRSPQLGAPGPETSE
jgi:hypothetical protein